MPAKRELDKAAETFARSIVFGVRCPHLILSYHISVALLQLLGGQLRQSSDNQIVGDSGDRMRSCEIKSVRCVALRHGVRSNLCPEFGRQLEESGRPTLVVLNFMTMELLGYHSLMLCADLS